MNTNQVIGIGVGVVALIVLAVGGSMWAMSSPVEDVPVAGAQTASLDKMEEGPAMGARSAGARGGGSKSERAAAARAKIAQMSPEQKAELKAKIQARKASKGAKGARTAGAAGAAGAKGKAGARGAKSAAKAEAMNQKLDAYAKDAGWDTETTEEVRSIIDETKLHIKDTMIASRTAGGDRAAAKTEIGSYREEQAALMKELVGEDEFDGFVTAMGMERFFSGASDDLEPASP